MINYLFLCMNWYVNLNGQTKLEIDGLTDRRAALFKGNIAGAADLKDLVVAHQIDEFIDFSRFGGQAKHQGILGVIHGLRAERVRRGKDVTARFGIVFQLNEHQLTADGGVRGKLFNGANVRQLIKLVHELLLLRLAALKRDGDAGKRVRFRFTDGQRNDVELTSSEHARHTVQHAELVIDQNRYGISIHLIHPPS